MVNNNAMADLQLTQNRLELLSQIRYRAASSLTLQTLQQDIVEMSSRQFPHFSWTGFYMLDPEDSETLVLGPFVGAPTPHIRIPVVEGICGAAVALGETIIVDDVGLDPRYLFCSLHTKSEIVVPIYVKGKVIDEININSHDPAAFGEQDKLFLEEAARIVANYIESQPIEPAAAQIKSSWPA